MEIKNRRKFARQNTNLPQVENIVGAMKALAEGGDRGT